MKSITNVYPKLLEAEYIKEIILLAAKGKKNRASVRRVLDNLDAYADKIVEMLKNKTYYLRPTHNKEIVEKGKKRMLTISPFYPNRIIDYIVTTTCKPYIKRSMYRYCVGNVDKRGISDGKKYIARNYKKYKYYIKLDIRHFYPSVTSDALCAFLSRKIRDRDFLDLCVFLVRSCPDMPIGSYYSQWFSNWYLEEIDHKIKEQYGAELYVRYVDDMLIMSNNRRKLSRIMYSISRELAPLGLSLKRFERPEEVSVRPIYFLGFRFCREEIKLRVRNFRRLNRRARSARRHICVSIARSLLSLVGWLKQIKCGYLYYHNHIKVKLGTLRAIVSSWERKRKWLNRMIFA